MADFPSVAERLYSLHPDEFAAQRDEEIKNARAAGDRALATELGKLRKPTISAWLINLLWRDQRLVMEQLFELANELNQAQARAAGSELRALTQQRREIETALLRRGKELAEQGGAQVSASTEREAQETLSAALAMPEVADEVRTGRLVKPTSYVGFGGFPTTVPARPAPAPEERREREPAPREPIDFDEKAAQRARERRSAAERQVQDARAVLQDASEALDERVKSFDEAKRRQTELGDELESLRERVRELEQQIPAVERAMARAIRERDAAEKEEAAARRDLQRAEKELAELD